MTDFACADLWFFTIFNSMWGQDEPQSRRYAIPLNCSMAVMADMRAIALGRKNHLFVRSQAGGKSAAIACTLIETAKPNGVDPQASLVDTLARFPDHKINLIDDLRPWNAR